MIEFREREICPACGWIHYLQLKASAGCCVEKDGKLLLVQRGIEPFKGTWHMPAGYIEVDELPARAAERETLEESGLVVSANNLFGAYFYDDDPRGNGVVLLYEAVLRGGNLNGSSETTSARFFTTEEIVQLTLAGVSAEASIHDWMDKKRKTHGNS
jgi:ADP-ribose pyrophosphatase YjhB (NUDIX family)